MRYSTGLGLSLMIACLLTLAMVHDVKTKLAQHDKNLWMRLSLQKKVGLPNLSITTAARYLRHYSLTDLSTPFQDYPASLDHFPAGFAFGAPDFSNFVSPLNLRNHQTPLKP